MPHLPMLALDLLLLFCLQLLCQKNIYICSFHHFFDQLALYISLVCVLLNNTVCKF